ncbi:hypothetical protein CLIB1444_04S08856 [[Candida] jaroonii]|uniref:Uncharacterized protein n=1 Tax=[Candida] jaroonii TaxID=467808 RepID=A0ACA9Y772_9ASCO|nr:hypothetical protein CLIB1444_04S08856 [[Candida] jaroonii]
MADTKGKTRPIEQVAHDFKPGLEATNFEGSSFKLLKACNFCRKRKIKCTVQPKENVCENCKDHKKKCIFDHKKIRKIKKVKLEKVTELTNTKNLNNYTGTFLDQIDPFAMEQYNKSNMQSPEQQWTIPVSISNFSNSPSYQDTNNNSVEYQLYVNNIEPYTPFLDHKIFQNNLDHFSKCCIHVSAVSSSKNEIPESAVSFFYQSLNGYFNEEIKWDPIRLSCFFLLPSRTVIPKKLIKDSLESFNRFYESQELSVNLLAGAICVDGWNSLFNEHPLITDKSIIKKSSKIFQTMDIDAYNYQFLNCNIFLYELIWLLHHDNLSFEEKRSSYLQFEFDMLLFPAKLSKNLIVVKDTLLSTPEAFLLHILHNMVLIAYYTVMVKNKKLGEVSAICAVPGLYHFISGMAISNFRVTLDLVNRWSVIADCQIYTAKLLLQLYSEMEFEIFRFTLSFYTRRINTNFSKHEYDPIDKEVKVFIESSVIPRDDDFDGAVVFWVFRDVRSMSLQLYINDKNRRGSEVDVSTAGSSVSMIE